MNNKLIYSNYDSETGKSIVIIRNKYGTFKGKVYIDQEDKKYESKFFGCRLAEIKAVIKCYKYQKNNIKEQLKSLQQLDLDFQKMKEYNNKSFEARRLKRRIFELKQKEQEIENKISTCKDVYQKEIASRNLITETFKNVEKNNSNFKTEYKKNLKKDKND